MTKAQQLNQLIQEKLGEQIAATQLEFNELTIEVEKPLIRSVLLELRDKEHFNFEN